MRCRTCGEKENIFWVYNDDDFQLGVMCGECKRLSGIYLVYEVYGLEGLLENFNLDKNRINKKLIWRWWIMDLFEDGFLKEDLEKAIQFGS